MVIDLKRRRFLIATCTIVLVFVFMLSGLRVMAAACSSLASVAPSKFHVIYVTCPDANVSKTIARGLIENNLAACVNIIPKITSVYRWEGKVSEDEEYLLVVKSKSSVFEKLSTFVKSNHPYKVPEIISLPIQQGSADYLNWIDTEVKEL